MRIIAAAALCIGLSACTEPVKPHNTQTGQTVQCPAREYLWTIASVIREKQYPQCW